MTTFYTVLSICVALLTVAGVFMRLAFHMGQMTKQLETIVKTAETMSGQIKELFEWRYQNAVRSQKGRGGLPRD